MNITCEAEAEPPATFQWYRNKKHLDPKQYQITSGEHISTLQVEYILIASNKNQLNNIFTVLDSFE